MGTRYEHSDEMIPPHAVDKKSSKTTKLDCFA